MRSKARRIVFILNPAPESAAFTTHRRAERHVELKSARWISDNQIEFIRTTTQQIDVEMAAQMRYRRMVKDHMEEVPVDRAIVKTRYGVTSWSGSKHVNVPHWKTPVPIKPGQARS
jgi:uncharacterized NAD(P)/FAD-binding protein YdhS